MPKVIGYGEDALTYWVLTKKIDLILINLGDQSKPSECLVIYRPSFGRHGGPGKALFGELDSILATPQSIYLIESKWDGSYKNKREVIKLRPEQILRHEIFSWYYHNWSSQQYRDLGDFINALESSFIDRFPDKRMAPPGSKTAQNLEFVLKKLHEHCQKEKDLKNVLLYFYKSSKSKQIQKVTANGEDTNFKVINIDYEPHISGNYIYLD